MLNLEDEKLKGKKVFNSFKTIYLQCKIPKWFETVLK